MLMHVETPELFTFPGGLTSLTVNATPDDPHWMAGYQYMDAARPRTARNWDNNRTVAGINQGTGAAPEVIETVPIMLEIEGVVSAMVHDRDDIEAIGRQQLETYTSRMLERELWTGEIAQAVDPDLPNRYLAQAGSTDVTPSGTANDLSRCIAALVNAGSTVIHVPAFLGAQLKPEWRNNDALSTEGFVVVAGRGYPVDISEAGVLIYGTDAVAHRLSEIEVLPSFDQYTNTFTYLAQRLGAADFAGPVHSARVTY